MTPFPAEPIIRVLPLARQPEGLDVPLHGLPWGAFFAAPTTGGGLPELERAIRRGRLTGIVAVATPRCWRVYRRGRCKYESLSESCAYQALAAFVERPGWRKRLAVWLLDWHDQGTADRLLAAARGLRP